MNNAEQFAFKVADSRLGEASYRPMLSLELVYRGRSVIVDGLLDTGAMVNVLPYHLGLALGAVWEQQQTSIQLAGNLARFEARALVVSATVGRFAPVRQAFAWTRTSDVPLLLGQVNFFQNFDVCFFRSELVFEVRPKGIQSN